jgi:hypothetical protein
MEIERKKNLYEWCSCCQEDKRLLYGKGPHAHPLSHFLFFFLPQNTNHKLHGRRQTQGKKKNSKFKIQNQNITILCFYSRVFSYIFSDNHQLETAKKKTI